MKSMSRIGFMFAGIGLLSPASTWAFEIPPGGVIDPAGLQMFISGGYNTTTDEYIFTTQGCQQAPCSAPQAFKALLSPAGVVSGAAFVSPATVVQETRVAHNPDRNEYLLVWRNDSPQDIYGLYLNGDGTPKGNYFGIATSGLTDTHPWVAYSTSSQRYMVLWSQSGSTVFRMIDGNSDSAPPHYVGGVVTVEAGVTIGTGRVAYGSVSDKFLVVFVKETSRSDDIFGRFVSGDGTIVSTGDANRLWLATALKSQQITDGAASIAYASSQDRWIVIYQDWNLGTYPKGVAMLIDSAGSVTNRVTFASEAGWNATGGVAYNSVSDTFLAAWRTEPYGKAREIDPADGSMGSVIVLSDRSPWPPAVAAREHPTTPQFLVLWYTDPNGLDGVHAGIIATIPVEQPPTPEMVIGLGNQGAGQIERIGSIPPYSATGWAQVGWPAYNTANGETRPAFCDVDGDGKDELVIGLGPGAEGWLQVKDDRQADYAHLAWIRVNWSLYNAANGETFPACGDVDGDQKDEIVVGLGAGGDGWLRAFDDAATGYADLPSTPYPGGWIRLLWPAYNTSRGEVHPAIGNLDGDPNEELVLGLSSTSDGWVQVLNDAAGAFAPLGPLNGWLRVSWPVYNTGNGETWPAVGDLNGDGKGEIVLGLGQGGGGFLQVRGNAAAGYAPVAGTPYSNGWFQMNLVGYIASVGTTFPTVGDIDADGKAEVVIGMDTYPTNGGWIEFRKDLSESLAHDAWVQVSWTAYNGLNGATRPAVRRH